MVGGGGGASVAATDACAAVGLTVPPFDDALRARLAEILPLAGTMMRNPVDVGVPLVPPNVFQSVLETVAGVENVDTLIATQPLFYVLGGHFPMGSPEEIVRALVDIPAAVRDKFGKPVVIVLPVGGEEVEMADAERGRRRARQVSRDGNTGAADPGPGSEGGGERGDVLRENSVERLTRDGKDSEMTEPSFDLSGRVAIVTGGSRGIGRAIALGLATYGADVVVASRKQEDLDVVAGEIRALGRKAVATATHMRNREDIERLVEATLEEFGKIDILVNNAGTNPYFGPFLQMEERTWDQIMTVNLKGYYLLAQAVSKGMIERKSGNIINVASTGARRRRRAWALLISGRRLCCSGAGRTGPHSIRVNAIAPASYRRFAEALWSNEAILKDDGDDAAGRIGRRRRWRASRVASIDASF
jgi:NAD(P)-dependent dehydrogenase (short-subunit alcohol dehydrogenase family)